MFVYQLTFNVLEFKIGKATEYITDWKSKGLHGAFLPNVKYFGVNIGIQFIPSVIGKINYASKIVNVYIIYDLDKWPKNPLRNLTLQSCLFGVTSIVKSSDREKYVYSGYGIAFVGKGEWSFGNDSAKNVIIFGVDNSSSSHTDNLKNEGPSFGINGSFGASKRKTKKQMILILVKQRQSFVWVCIIMLIIVTSL